MKNQTELLVKITVVEDLKLDRLRGEDNSNFQNKNSEKNNKSCSHLLSSFQQACMSVDVF